MSNNNTTPPLNDNNIYLDNGTQSISFNGNGINRNLGLGVTAPATKFYIHDFSTTKKAIDMRKIVIVRYETDTGDDDLVDRLNAAIYNTDLSKKITFVSMVQETVKKINTDNNNDVNVLGSVI